MRSVAVSDARRKNGAAMKAMDDHLVAVSRAKEKDAAKERQQELSLESANPCPGAKCDGTMMDGSGNIRFKGERPQKECDT